MLRPPNASVRCLASSPTSRQFLRFSLVGASGYLINLTVYATLLVAGLHYLAAATVSFLAAAASNYIWNRIWTFQTRQARLFSQSLRSVAVSALSLGVNQLFLVMLVTAGTPHLPAQAVSIVLVTPFSFAANKRWAFADGGHAPALFETLPRSDRRLPT